MKAYTKNKESDAAGRKKKNFAGSGTEDVRGLGVSLNAISQSSYYLTADKQL